MKVARVDWPKGPWDDEPDDMLWTTAAGGIAHLHRNPMDGTWCGYVPVPKGHMLYGLKGDHSVLRDMPVYGGVSYARDVCPACKDVSPRDLWWIGFDCLHGGDDVAPALLKAQPRFRWPGFQELYPNAVYRDLAFAKLECEKMAAAFAVITERVENIRAGRGCAYCGAPLAEEGTVFCGVRCCADYEARGT